MKACKRCGSYAINHNCHGRDGSDRDLCDVCYWRKRAEQAKSPQKLLPIPRVLIDELRDDGLFFRSCDEIATEIVAEFCRVNGLGQGRQQ